MLRRPKPLHPAGVETGAVIGYRQQTWSGS
jgi:hypothetical protein